MTDKPNTLGLNARQWRVLMNDHLEVLKGAVAASEVLNEPGLANVVRHLDEVRLMATAWFQNSPKAEQEAVTHVAEANGAAPEKKRGGWPKGRKRNAPAQVVQ